MHKSILSKIELFCPRCRRPGKKSIIQYPLKLSEVYKTYPHRIDQNMDDDFIIDGLLTCTNEHCRFNHPIVSGVPIILKDTETWMSRQQAGWFNQTLESCALGNYLHQLADDPSQAYMQKSLLGTYLDFHYGNQSDLTEFLADQADPGRYWQTIIKMAQPHDDKGYRRALDLGCSAGRYTFELARISQVAIGIDIDFAPVMMAARFSREKKVIYDRKIYGRKFTRHKTDYQPGSNVMFLVADALNPPFKAESFDLVAGLNLIDSIGEPVILIGQMDALLKPAGILLTGSPYEWRPDICDFSQWLESDELNSPEILKQIFTGKFLPQLELAYQVLEEHENIPWVLRNHDHYFSLFLAHLLKFQKTDALP